MQHYPASDREARQNRKKITKNKKGKKRGKNDTHRGNLLLDILVLAQEVVHPVYREVGAGLLVVICTVVRGA